MMQITVHFGLLALMLGSAFIVGLLFRMVQIASLRKQVFELEKEKMHDHAEILQLQKQVAENQQAKYNQQTSTPVVPLMEKELVASELAKKKRASQK